ncbi:MAG: hypothetical protein FD138_3552 [Planctomycetota bacterium]|nr:MAG: hypothetical protein FD138_3552 [Planctomycetota bacterium]
MFERWSFPSGFAFGEFISGDVHVDGPFVGVDRDFVAGLDERDRAALLSLWRDVTDDEAV